jgi:hypothetical protein
LCLVTILKAYEITFPTSLNSSKSDSALSRKVPVKLQKWNKVKEFNYSHMFSVIFQSNSISVVSQVLCGLMRYRILMNLGLLERIVTRHKNISYLL